MQIHTTCRHCRDTQLMSTAQPELRISYMPDEHAYLTWPCSECGEWQAKLLDARPPKQPACRSIRTPNSDSKHAPTRPPCWPSRSTTSSTDPVHDEYGHPNER